MSFKDSENFEWWGYTYWTLSNCQRCDRPPKLATEGGFLAYVMWYKNSSRNEEKWCEDCFETWKMERIL